MPSWRERGYVPDSDDEEDDRDSDVQHDHSHENIPADQPGEAHVPAPAEDVTVADFEDLRDSHVSPTNDGSEALKAHAENGYHRQDGLEKSSPDRDNVPTSTATKLQAEIQRGLKTIQDVLGFLPSALDSDDDSPLSSVPPSVQSTPRNPGRKTFQDVLGSLSSVLDSRTDGPPPSASSSTGNTARQCASVGTRPAVAIEVTVPQPQVSNNIPFNAEDEAPRRRSFRPRAPIQLHPYALEDARYRQTWSARGLKPVRAPEITSNSEKTSNEESQDTTAYESSQMDSFDAPARHSSPTLDDPEGSRSAVNDESQSPIRGTRVRQPSPLSDSEDDLPDLSDILNSRTTISSASKLKNLKQRSWREPRTGKDGFHIYDLPDDDAIVQPPSRTHRVSSVTPLSPPYSRGGRSSQDAVLASNADGLGGNSTPALLPTPLVSSDKYASKRTFAEFLDISDPESNIINISDDAGVSSSSEESSGDESQGVQQLRRKIKGVLPASWLKLDMKQKHTPRRSSGHHVQQSPVKIAAEKGVAKHIPSSGRRAARNHGPTHVIEDDTPVLTSSSDSDAELQANEEMDDVQYDLSRIYEDDVMEDNTVDAMLAPRMRSSNLSKRQRLFSGVRSKKVSERSRKKTGGERPWSHHGDKAMVAARSKARTRPSKKIKRTHKNPHITILDAPGFKQKDIPRFLRIASRRTGDANTARHQDPSRKFFRLATMRDTQDVNESLRRWETRRDEVHPAVEVNFGHGLPSRTALCVPRPRGVNTVNDEITETLGHGRLPRHGGVDDSDLQLLSLKLGTNATLQRIRSHLNRDRSQPGEFPASSVGPSTVILDYFQPRTSYRSHLISGHLSRDEFGPLVPDDAPVSRLDSFAIQKLVPRHASARRERPNYNAVRQTHARAPAQPQPRIAGLSAHGGLTPPPREPARLRPPKKQRPIDLGTRLDDQSGIQYLQSLSLDDGKDIITNAIRYPPGRASLLNTGAPPGAQPIRFSLVRATLSSMASSAGLFESGWISNTITTPKSRRTLEAAGWTSAVEATLRDSFAEILEITCNDVAAPDLSTWERIELLNRAADSIEAIVTYVNESLTFSGEQELEAFLQLTSAYMEKIWRAMAECEAATSDSHASRVLKVLNGLLLLGYQVAERAMSVTPDTVRTRISETRKSMARLAWELAFREEHIAHLFAYVSAPAGTNPALDARRSCYAAEIETILFIHRLGPHQGWSFYMRHILFADDATSETHRLQSSAESLACTTLVLGCILSISGSEGLSSTHDMPSSMSLGSSLVGVLVSRVSDFLKSFVEYKTIHNRRLKKRSPSVKRLEQFGPIMFRWCFLLARNYLHDLADDLLKAMFKYYSENGMAGLFTPPAPVGMDRMPQFLKDQVPARELLPEDNDTDFDVFLKLTAIALTPRLPATSETVEHTKKLQLRKRSLLFLMLPNRGRDLTLEKLSLFDEDKDLALTDFAGIANRYRLFATLYHYAPTESKPVLAQISNYVDFSTAHDRVREVILESWTSLVTSVLSQPINGAKLQELGQWIRQMFFSMCGKLDNIPKYNNNIASVDESLRAEYHVHRINRETTADCLHQIAVRYGTAVDLCANEEQVSCLLPREEMSSLILRCYTDRDLGDNAVRQVFCLLTSYIKKGLKKEREALLLFRRDLRGLLVDQLTRNKEQDESDFERLLVSMAEAWYALGRIMVTEGPAHWDQFLNDWSPMSFPQITDGENGRHCQVLLMSRIATERDIVLAEPYPFIHVLLRSILRPVLAGSKIFFVHRLLNQLMESIPDAFALDGLRRRLSNGVSPFFLDKFDVINNRFAIVDHFIRYAYVVRPAADEHLLGDLKTGQWNDLMAMISTTLKRTMRQGLGEAQPEWMMFSQKVLFRLTLYGGPGNGSDSWLAELNDGVVESNAFRLERFFVCSPDRNKPTDLETGRTAKVFRSALESACLKKMEDVLVPHLVTIFAASHSDYVDSEGRFLLDISEQLNFLKAVFPAYIESALDHDHPAMLLAVPVLDIAIGILRSLEVRIDLEDQAHMESFAELIAVWMSAAIKAMQHTMPTAMKEHGWQFETVSRLVDLVAAGSGRWAHLHNLFPSSPVILGFQQLVQTYACYAYGYVCSTAGSDVDVLRLDSPFPEERNDVERWAFDFGFEIEEVSVPERVIALNNAAANDLRAVGTDWCKVGFTTYGPVWELRRSGSPAMARAKEGTVGHGTMFVSLQEAVARLQRVLVLLGLVDEVL
ncbi:hypothetical protein PV04_10138 [Phialophora macrospora]|uniref:Uncharacterized protein n=1 Tax=Phialophora macrospora TaxID=1851006 RepID=A0A0D2DLJ6_9EURO|nr:hypothetical protein PV04_10138 [Phialophora macrospora]